MNRGFQNIIGGALILSLIFTLIPSIPLWISQVIMGISGLIIILNAN